MESAELIQFYNSVKQWPGSQAEMDLGTGLICKILNAGYAAVSYQSSERSLFSVFVARDLQSETGVSEEVFHDFAYKQLHEQRADTGAIRLFQMKSEGTPLSRVMTSFHLTLGSLKNFGSLLVCGEKPLRSKEEILFAAICEHLGELASIAQLESALKLRSQFLSIASHELKTPLTSIYGVLQLQERMLKVKKDEPPVVQLERQESFLKIVIRQVERLNELIDGLLDVSRIHNGRFMVEPSDTDVALLLRDAANSRLAVIAQEAGVKLHLDSPESLQAWVDPVRMEEVITNLVMNAIRFSPEGGVVWIKLTEDNDTLKLSVRDQGPSVPMEDRERIFQPFERAQRTGRLGGLGLGLFISREITQLHGGAVKLVESIPGKGNLFEAQLPLRNINRISA